MNPLEYRLQQLETGLTNHWYSLNYLIQRMNMLESAVKTHVTTALQPKKNNVLSLSQMELLAHRISTMEMTIQQLLKKKQSAKTQQSSLNKDDDVLYSIKNNYHHHHHPMPNKNGDGPKIPSSTDEVVTNSQTRLYSDVIGQDKNGIPTWMNIMMEQQQQQQQKSIGPPSSMPEELKKSFIFLNTSNLRDEMLKKVRELCNKLNLANFNTLSKEFLTLFLTRQDDHEEEQRIRLEILSFIFGRAVAEVDNPSSPTCYARLMAEIKTCDTSNPLLYQTMLNQLSALSSSHFSQLFEDDDKVSLIPSSSSTPSTTTNTNTTDSNNLGKDLAQLETTRRKHQGILRFIGELFKVDIISMNDMKTFVDCLLVHPQETGLYHLCYLLKIIGEKLETTVMDNPWFKDVVLELAMKKDFMTNKTKFAIMDILELKAKGWKVEAGHQQSTTSTSKGSTTTTKADNVPSWRATVKSPAGPVPLLSLDLTTPLVSTASSSSSLMTTPPSSSAGGSNSQLPVAASGDASDDSKLTHSHTLTFKLFGKSIHKILDVVSKISTTKEQRTWVRDNIKCSLSSKTHTELGKDVVSEICRAAIHWPDKTKVGMAGSFLGYLHRGACVSRAGTIDALKTAIISELRQFAPEWNKADSILTNIGILLTHCFIKGNGLEWLMTMVTPDSVENVEGDDQMMFRLIFQNVSSQIQSIRGEETYFKLINHTKQHLSKTYHHYPVDLYLSNL